MDPGASVKALRCLTRAHWLQNRSQEALAVREVMTDSPISPGSLGAALKAQAGLYGCAWSFGQAAATSPISVATPDEGWPGGK